MVDENKTSRAKGIIGKVTRPFVYIFPACAIVALILRLMGFEVIDNGAKAGLLAVYCIFGLFFILSYYFNKLKIVDVVILGIVLVLSITAFELLVVNLIAAAAVIPSILRRKKLGLIIVGAVYILMMVFGGILTTNTLLYRAVVDTKFQYKYMDAPDGKHTACIKESINESGRGAFSSLDIYQTTPIFIARKIKHYRVSDPIYNIKIDWLDNTMIRAQWYRSLSLHIKLVNIDSTADEVFDPTK